MSVYRRKKSSASPVTVLVSVFVALAVVCGGGFLVWKNNTQDKIDKVTLCPSSGPKAQYVVLIDNTSPFPFTQRLALKQRLKDLVANDLPTGAILTVFVLGEDFKQNATPLFARCNPGQWDDADSLTKTKKFVDNAYAERFFKPLEDVVNHIPMDVRGKTSPIFEMLQVASNNGFKHEHANGEKRLIIFSDMAANTSDFTMYKRPQLNYKDFESSDYARKATAPALNGVSVTLNMMAAEPGVTPYVKRSEFWARFFSTNGANLDGVEPMEGL